MKVVCRVNNLCFSYIRGRQILSGISFSVRQGELVGILGKNGSGKSTLLNIIAGFHSNYEGNVVINEKEMKGITLKERAKTISYIQQKKIVIPDYYKTEDFIMEGRRPFRNLGIYTKDDYDMLEHTMKECGVADFYGRYINDLSGGELQRCVFARAIMKQSSLYLFDEPCSAMDIKYQKDFFWAVETIKETKSCAILITIHDINLAIQNCDRIILLDDGRIIYNGNSREITSALLSEAFDTPVKTNPYPNLRYFYY